MLIGPGLPGRASVRGTGSGKAPAAPGTTAERLQAAAGEFESILWEAVLRNLRSAHEGLAGRPAVQERDLYWSWFEQTMARQMAGGSGGLAAELVRQVAGQNADKGRP